MADHDIPLASLSLTHVFYDPSDPVSYLCAWLALVPQALCIVYVTLIWSTREAEVLLMFAGQLACEAVNFALKRLIKEERPQRIHKTGKGYGMPSSHAQFVFFWAVAMTLFLLVRHAPRWTDHGYAPQQQLLQEQQQQQQQQQNGSTPTGGAGNADDDHDGQQLRRDQRRGSWGADWVVVETYAHRPWSRAERALASALVLGVAAAVAWSRVYLGYHTPRQVAVGAAAGAASALAWYAATAAVRAAGLLLWALESPPARGLRLRDLVVTEDLAQAGWEKWETREAAASTAEQAAARNKKKKKKKRT